MLSEFSHIDIGKRLGRSERFGALQPDLQLQGVIMLTDRLEIPSPSLFALMQSRGIAGMYRFRADGEKLELEASAPGIEELDDLISRLGGIGSEQVFEIISTVNDMLPDDSPENLFEPFQAVATNLMYCAALANMIISASAITDDSEE